MGTIRKALIITPRDNGKLTAYAPGYLVVSGKGVIEYAGKDDPRKRFKGYRFIDLSDRLICPGFVDIHNHLPQYAFSGIGGDELLPWLKRYTFPRESGFNDPRTATAAAKTFFRDLLANGTTTTVTYVTIHEKATDIAFREAQMCGIRAVIGKVMMDQNSPRALTEDPEKSLRESAELIDKWHGRDGRLFYALTPRFAISCSFGLMKRIGELARAKGVYIQTHLSENPAEIAFTKKLFPKSTDYTDVYGRAGLLGPKSVMAHCIHLSNKEMNLLKSTGTRIAHCPSSNNFLGSGIMPFRKYRRAGLPMGLGTDVAGGYSLSMLNEMKVAIESSKYAELFLGDDKDGNPRKTRSESGYKAGKTGVHSPPMTVAEAFYLATFGGAKALSLEKETGSLEEGKRADFLVIDHLKTDPSGAKSAYLKPEQILSKLIYRGGRDNIKEVFIGGKMVASAKNRAPAFSNK